MASVLSNPGDAIAGLGDSLEDQTAFAKRCWKIIEELGYGDQLGEDPDRQEPEETESDSEDEEQQDDSQSEEGGEESDQQEYLPDDMRGEQDDTQQMEITLEEAANGK